MKCEHCGAIIHEGDTFCRTCATPVKKDEYIDRSRNKATVGFADKDKAREIVSTEPEKKFSFKDEVTKFKNKQALKTPEPSKPVDNKAIIKKDGNDRVKATVINVGGLVALIIIIIILIIIFINILGNL